MSVLIGNVSARAKKRLVWPIKFVCKTKYKGDLKGLYGTVNLLD